MTDVQARRFRKKRKSLVPGDWMAEEDLDAIPDGADVFVTMRRARSAKNHSHFFAILRRALKHLPEGLRIFDERALLDSLKLEVGHVRRVRKFNGEISEMPDSIDFQSMPEDQFIRFKERALYVLGQVIGCDPCELEPEEPKRRAA